MEWWQIFGLLFVFCVVMYFYDALAKDRKRRAEEKEAYRMTQPENSGDWEHPGALQETPKAEPLMKIRSEEESESIITRLPRAINHRINLRQDQKTLKEQVKIGELQVQHITNANKFADQKFELENKTKENTIKTLDQDRQILEKQSNLADHADMEDLRTLKKESNRLDYEIDIAEKRSRKAAFENPTSTARSQTREEIRAEKEKKIESSMADIRERIARTKNDDSLDESERTMLVNQLKNKLFEAQQELIDLL